MSRYRRTENGELPKKLFIHQYPHCVGGPYFTNVALQYGNNGVKIEYTLCPITGNYLRVDPLVKEKKGKKINLNI